MNFEFLRKIAAEAVDLELSQIEETKDTKEGLVSHADIAVDAQPAKSPGTEEDEYDWIVRSTPSALESRITFDELNEPNSTPRVELFKAEDSEPMWHGRLARGLESRPVAGQEDFAAEWSAPELTVPVNLSDIEAREAEENLSLSLSEKEDFAAEWSAPDLAVPVNVSDVDEHAAVEKASLPVSGEVEFADEWSAPDLTPEVHFSDIEVHEPEANASLSASAEEELEDELSEVTLAPQAVSLSHIEGREAEATASFSVSEQEDFADEASDLTLASRPTDLSETASEHEESAAPSRTEETLDHIGPIPQPNERLSVQYQAIHVLKDPPEIWDQVPEQPAEFHPAFAFLARVTANNEKLLWMTLTVMLVCGLGTFAVLKLRQADSGNASVVQAPPEHRIEVPRPTVAATAPTETGPTAQKSAASSVDSSDKSPATSAASSSRDAEKKNTSKPADSAETAKTSTETSNKTAHAAKNSGKGNAPASTANAANKAKSAPTSVARSASKDATRRNAPTVARNTTPSRNSTATSRSTSTPSNSSPSTARKPEPARVITVGNGETRPRLVTPRTSVTKNLRG